MDGIPHLESRLRCWLFASRFQLRVDALRPVSLSLLSLSLSLSFILMLLCPQQLDTLLFACEQVKKSPSFLKMLEIILAVGNYVNGKTFRGNCWGFKIESLNKLKDTRANTGGLTMLSYLAEYCLQSQLPTLTSSDLQRELAHVMDAAHISLVAVREDFESVNALYKLCESLASDGANTDAPLKKLLSDFVAATRATMSALAACVDELKSALQSVAKFYVEDERSFNPEVFFAHIATFCVDFERATTEMVGKQEQDKKKQMAASMAAAAAAARQQQPLASASRPAPPSIPVSPPPKPTTTTTSSTEPPVVGGGVREERGMMDSVIRQLGQASMLAELRANRNTVRMSRTLDPRRMTRRMHLQQMSTISAEWINNSATKSPASAATTSSSS